MRNNSFLCQVIPTDINDSLSILADIVQRIRIVKSEIVDIKSYLYENRSIRENTEQYLNTLENDMAQLYGEINAIDLLIYEEEQKWYIP